MRKLLSFFALSIAGTTAIAAEPLPKLNLEPGVLVSGLSSGGAMAGQMHAAFSDTVKGVAVLAAAPYHCTGDNPKSEMRAEQLIDCVGGAPSSAPSIAKLRANAKAGLVDDLKSMADSRAYLFRGTIDPYVTPPVFKALTEFYREFLPADRIKVDADRPFGHAFVTDNPADAKCDSPDTPWVVNCKTDLAGDVLAWLTGSTLQPKSTKPGGKTITFDQKEFTGKDGLSMASDGYLYVPAACATGDKCRLVVVFHGCNQDASKVGDKVYGWPGAGYSPWADTNRMVVLYPQVVASMMTPYNPPGCWDWWGYNDPAWDTKNGLQLRAIKAMIDRLAGR